MRAAQIVIWVMAGAGLLFTFLVAAVSGARASGQFFSSFLLTVPLFVLAFRYPKAGNGVRIASIVLASVQIVLGLGSLANRVAGAPVALGGAIALAGAIALVVLLSQGAASAWFRRPRPGAVPNHPYA
ncbi:hypothetical protein [Streptomyces sp. HD]|uniref:hypothetical protein n=1 Tax=Streptomyces sp. HD TaxID=3020892 RepID=UPI002330D408|nr:hypothetical protein [Streptomyces sp. HD]MDC0773049.1 hypothetical protein [Streptomyces sp. HD]